MSDIASVLNNYPDIAVPILTRATLEASLLFEREVKEHTPSGAYGALKSSILSSGPDMMDGNILGTVGTALPYAQAVELGSKPHMPPIAPLIDWARAKFGLPEDEAKSAAWAVATIIKKKGTKGKKMFAKAVELTSPQIQQIFESALVEILAEVAKRAGHIEVKL